MKPTVEPVTVERLVRIRLRIVMLTIPTLTRMGENKLEK